MALVLAERGAARGRVQRGVVGTTAKPPPPARADEAAREASSTIVVISAVGDRFGLRVQAELEALGFRAVLLDAAVEPASRLSLEVAARNAGAVAAIRAIPSERGVEVWIADRVTGKTVVREIVSADGAIDRDAALALSAVDLLRASLLEITLPASPPGEVLATPEIRERMALTAPRSLEEARPPTLRLSLASGALLSPGGFGAAASVGLGLDWMPSEHVGVVALAAIPLSSARIEGAPGSVDLAVLLAGGGARFLVAARESPWSPTADLGLIAVALRSTGSANPGFRASSPSAVTPAPFARFGLGFALTRSLRLRADVLVGLIVQGVSIQVAQRELATWGKPLVLSSFGVDFGWL